VLPTTRATTTPSTAETKIRTATVSRNNFARESTPLT
jgi:hypothetical protein